MPDTPSAKSKAEAARQYAKLGIAIAASHYPVGLPDNDAHGLRRLACSCGGGDCPTPASHALDAVPPADPGASPEQGAAWWTHEPQANLAAVTGTVFSALELRHPAPAGHLIDWLVAHGIEPGPALEAAPNTLQFLVGPTDPAACYAPLPGGGVLRVAAGSLILLPPSERVDRYPIRWRRHLPAARTAFPDGEELWTILARLPRADLLSRWATGDEIDEQALVPAGQP
jgi:hypothetical protein